MASRASVAAPPIIERRYAIAFALITSLFFSWALAAALNDVLIRQFQKALDLTRTEASLIQFAFYVGYFCAAVPAGLLIRRLGYKNTILIGLACYAGGAFLFYPAAATERFGLFLIALYVIAIGLAFLETASNPYVTILGAAETASSRLNLAQSFYGIGAVIGPIIGGLFIFSGDERTQAQIAAMAPAERAAWRTAAATAVQGPYLAIGAVVCLLALLIALTRFPVLERAKAAPGSSRSLFAVLRHRRLRAAILTLFLYVGAQVGVWSFFIDFTKAQAPHLSERTTAFLLSASLGMLMIGRFSGAFLQKRIPPARLLAIYAAASVLLCGFAAIASGMPAVGALWLTSFFMSIMFPTIFALGVEGLGDETESGAAFLIMAIIGGAVFPPLMGIVSEQIGGGVHHMMFVPMLAFAGVLVFAALRLREGTAK